MMKHRVVRLRRTGSPDDIQRVAAEKFRQPLTRLGDRRVRAAADAARPGPVDEESTNRRISSVVRPKPCWMTAHPPMTTYLAPASLSLRQRNSRSSSVGIRETSSPPSL